MIVLYPQAIVSSLIPYNPKACWDWCVRAPPRSIAPLFVWASQPFDQVGLHRHRVRLASRAPSGRHQANDQLPDAAVECTHSHPRRWVFPFHLRLMLYAVRTVFYFPSCSEVGQYWASYF